MRRVVKSGAPLCFKMDTQDKLLEIEEQITDAESHEAFHEGDRGYQDLLLKKEELTRLLEEEIDEAAESKVDPDEPEQSPETPPQLVGYVLRPPEYAAVTNSLKRLPYETISDVMKILENLPVLQDNQLAPTE